MARLYFIFIPFLFAWTIATPSTAQQTARMTTGGTGYLERLPSDYATNPTRKYPVLFFLHGSGETGSGSPADLEKVKAHGPPYSIANGHNMCFTVNGVEECFIVISPQLGNQGGWWPSVLNDVFSYVLSGPQNYRVDMSRVYLTGLSLGGWGVYIGAGDLGVPDIFAAAAPVSAFGNGNGCTLSARKIPMWGFHGESDGTILYTTGLSEFNNTRNCTAPVPTAELKWTSYPGQGHNIWTNFAYRTDNNLHTPNLYQWLLTKSKSSLPNLVITNPAPACSPATVDITATAVTAGSTPGMTFTYWTDAAATNAYTTPTAATNGTYYINGTTATGSNTKSVTVTVNPSPSLVITNPASICPTATTNLTLTSITAGSTSGLTFSYWTNSSATTSLTNPTTASIGAYYIKGTALSGCNSVKPIIVSANPTPTVSITNPIAVCAPGTINLMAASVTAGSSSGLSFSYWADAGATNSLASPTAVSNGIYYIKGTNSFGCYDIKPVTATVNAIPNLIITNPPAACAPATINLTAASVTFGSSLGLSYSYWLDASASASLPNPTSVSTGTYYIKATNAASCSLVMPVSVTVNAIPSLVITDPAAVCEPFTIDITASSITSGSPSGLVFSYWTDAGSTNSLANPTTAANGVYFIRATNPFGCPDIKPVTAIVNANPNLVVANPSAVCAPSTIDLTDVSITNGSSSGLTYSYWIDANAIGPLVNPTSITSSNTYFIKTTNAASCISVKPVNATINPSPDLVITTPIAVCSPSTINLADPSVTIGTSAGFALSYWTDVSATNALPNPSSATTGVYYIKATNSFNCMTVMPVTVTVNDIPNLIVTNPTAVCEPASIDLIAPSITTGSSTEITLSYWTNATASSTLFNPASTTTGTYFIKALNQFGCTNIKPVNTIVKPMPIAIASPATSTICGGSSTAIQLSTSNTILGGVDYSWTPTLISGTVQGQSSGSGSSIGQNLTTNNLGGVVRYSIQSTSTTGGCPGVAITTDVTVNPVPDVAVNAAVSVPVICNGCSTYVIIKNPSTVSGTSFSWAATIQSGNVTGQSAGSGTTISQILRKTGADGIVRYTITPKAGNCQGSPIAYDVRINSSPTASAGPDLSITLPTNSITINGSGKDIDGTVASYLWTKIAGPTSFKLENQTTPSLTVKELIEGTYQFKLFVNDNDGAIGIDEMTLVVAPKANVPPVVSAGPDIKIQLPTDQVTITGTATDSDGTIKTLKWSQVTGPTASLKPFEYKLELSNLIEGSYTFRFSATDDRNTTVSDDLELIVSPNDFIPSIAHKKFITPNGDGQNDSWELDPDVAKFASCKLVILSNDGTKVFETTGYRNNWDGTRDGTPLPQDVYYYILDCNGIKDAGSITVIR